MDRTVTNAILKMGVGRTNYGAEIENKVIALALKKQLSENPLDIKEIEFAGSNRPVFKSGNCPCCNEYVDSDDDNKVCSNCGQKLEWNMR